MIVAFEVISSPLSVTRQRLSSHHKAAALTWHSLTVRFGVAKPSLHIGRIAFFIDLGPEALNARAFAGIEHFDLKRMVIGRDAHHAP
jgi:hypothetical protein